MNNENTEAVKSVSGGSIVLWLIGILTIIMGIAGRYIFVILAGVILLPITNTLTKKYLKINFSGTARFVIAVILVIGSVTVSNSFNEAREAVGDKAASENTASSSGAEEYTEVVSLEGKGNQNTESFNVTGKKVRVTATTCCGSSSSGSFSGVSLEKEDSKGSLGPGLMISTDGAEKGKGQTTYRNISPGRYYIEVISGIGWSVKVEQSN